MVHNMFSIHINLHDGNTYTIPIPRKFVPEFVLPSGIITPDGITFLLNEFYFLNQIHYAIIKCNDYASMFMLFGHKNIIRDSIVINTINTIRQLKDCSRIFNHTHIGINNFLTPEGVELIFGPQYYNNAWIYISNYFQVFKEYYEYCSEDVSQSDFYLYESFGDTNFSTIKTTQFVFFEEPKNTEQIDVNKFKSMCGNDTIFTRSIVMESVTPERKNKADEELVCPIAPKKARMQKN